MRTHAEVTDQEVQTFQRFANENGLVLEGADGEHNGNQFHQYLVVQQNQDITPESLAAAVNVLRPQLKWKSALQQEFDTINASVTAGERDTVNRWFERQKLVQTGDEGLENYIQVVGWLRDRHIAVTPQSLHTSLSNLAATSRRPLHWSPEPKRTEGYGRHSGKTFDSWKKDDGNREYFNGMRNHARNPKLQAEVPKSAQEAGWREKAEAVVGNRHSQTEMIRKLFVTDSSGKIDWRQTFEKRFRVGEGQRGTI